MIKKLKKSRSGHPFTYLAKCGLWKDTCLRQLKTPHYKFRLEQPNIRD
nr:MAG TPA: hypothetical protein [Caudoviricetes sp.]